MQETNHKDKPIDASNIYVYIYIYTYHEGGPFEKPLPVFLFPRCKAQAVHLALVVGADPFEEEPAGQAVPRGGLGVVLGAQHRDVAEGHREVPRLLAGHLAVVTTVLVDPILVGAPHQPFFGEVHHPFWGK